MNKIKNIEFIRVFLTLVIVFMHTTAYGSWSLLKNFPDVTELKFFHDIFIQGNNAVEGFFIIAGFLLIITLKDISVKEFIKKKYIRLSPVILFAVIICIIASLFHVIKLRFWDDILVILLLNNIGVCIAHGTTPVLWFTSALFGSLLIYFLVTKINSKKIKMLLFIFLPIISYGILEYLQHGSFSAPHKNYMVVFNVGFLRAMGGTGIGAIIGYLYKRYYSKIKSFNPNYVSYFCISSIEFALLCTVFWWLCYPHKQINCIFFVIVFALTLILFILKKGVISKTMDRDMWVNLGKYQYSIYVIHSVVGKILLGAIWNVNPYFVKIHPYSTISIIICMVLISGLITYKFVEKPCTIYLKNYIKQE